MQKFFKNNRLFDIINYLLLGSLAVAILYPLYFVVIASVSDPNLVNSGQVRFWPKEFTLEGYQLIFDRADIWQSYANTILYTICGTVLGTAATMLIAYVLSRKDFGGGRYIMVFLMVTMYFSGGLVPTYLVVSKLNLLNTRWIMMLMGSISVFNIIMARTFLQSSIPQELFEAAVIDGCTDFSFFKRVVLPLSKSILAVLALYYGVAHWNDYFNGLIYITDSHLQPLQLVLRSILIENSITAQDLGSVEDIIRRQELVEILKYGLIIVSTVPMLVVYPFIQKYFNQGVMIGSVKG